MKLINKFLTALAPVAMVGVLTPTLVACNKGSSYQIHYGDDVNCWDPTNHDVAYHSIDDVKNGIKGKINIHPTHDTLSVAKLNAELGTNWCQIFYYELIASHASLLVVEVPGILLTNWQETGGAIASFKFNGEEIQGAGEDKFIYANHDGKIYIEYNSTIVFPSYTYQYCTAIE